MSKEKLKKIWDIASNVLLYVFMAICIFSLGLTIFAKKDTDGTAEVFGYQLRIVVTESMAKSEHTDVSDFEIKSIPLRSMVFVEVVPEDEAAANAWYSELKVGDVLTFKYVYSSQVTITHRIISIEEKGEGYEIRLEGDNKSCEETSGVQIIDTSKAATSPNYIVGKVVGQSKILGFIMSILKEPAGLIFIIIIPCAIVIIMEIIKIMNVLNEEKQQKAKEENKKKDDELEELRRRLAALESSAAPPSAPEVKPEPVAEPEVKEEPTEKVETPLEEITDVTEETDVAKYAAEVEEAKEATEAEKVETEEVEETAKVEETAEVEETETVEEAAEVKETETVEAEATEEPKATEEAEETTEAVEDATEEVTEVEETEKAEAIEEAEAIED